MSDFHENPVAAAGEERDWSGVPITNPATPPYWPCPEYVTPDMEGPYLSTLLPCGCYLRQPDFEAILCPTHLAELNGAES